MVRDPLPDETDPVAVYLLAEDRDKSVAFGFRPLPPQLANGKGSVGFGIVADESVGSRMFAGMPRLVEVSVSSIALCPLHLAPYLPDIVVVEGPPEVLMWLLLADLNVHGGERLLRAEADLLVSDRPLISDC